jgi:tripartite-type tricarboxylate transporter receptor subunit TctC
LPWRNYDPVNDFVFVANLGNSFAALSVHPSVPANTFAEFVEYSRRNKGKVYYATAGIGSGQHLATS